MQDVIARHLDLLRRLGIDPNLDKDELLRQLTEKWRAGAGAQAEARKADKPVVVQPIANVAIAWDETSSRS